MSSMVGWYACVLARRVLLLSCFLLHTATVCISPALFFEAGSFCHEPKMVVYFGMGGGGG